MTTDYDILESEDFEVSKVPKFILDIPEDIIEKEDFMGDECGQPEEYLYSIKKLGNIGDTFQIKNDKKEGRYWIIIFVEKTKIKNKIAELTPSTADEMHDTYNEITIYSNLLNNPEPGTSEELKKTWEENIEKNKKEQINIKRRGRRKGIKIFKSYWNVFNKNKKYKRNQEIYVYKFDELLEPVQCAGCENREIIWDYIWEDELLKPCTHCIRIPVKKEDLYNKIGE